MKIRTIKQMQDGVFLVRIQTEDWSECDRSLMVKLGEPEIDLGGPITLDCGSSSSQEESVTMDSNYARVMTESPFTMKFDSRDYGDVDKAKCAADSWARDIVARIEDKVRDLRANYQFFTSEEIMEL